MFDEPAAESWLARYGTPAPELPSLDRFLTHRSIRSYRNEPIPDAVMSGLIAAAQSASTSSNLQLWSAILVREPGRREEIARLCGDQRQVREAAVFMAFFADHNRLRLAADAVGEGALGLDYEEFYTMAVVDAALAAERLVCAAESIGIGCCYIGALRNDPFAVKEFFQLPKGVFGVFGLSLGWPKEPVRAQIKPRLPQSAVVFEETYSCPGIGDYDERMRAFYESQQMKGDDTWSMRSGKRVDGRDLAGRERIRAFLAEQGFGLR